MALCEVLGSLADAVAMNYAERSGWQNLLIHILRSAPIYRDAGRLDAWDEAYRYARRGIDSAEPIVELLDAIADLGSYNMYGGYDAAGTVKECNRLVQKLQAEGVPVPADVDVSVW